MKNIICHFEIPTLDFQKSRDFYTQLFKWKIKAWGTDYWLVNTGSKEDRGGIMLSKPEEFKPGIDVYVLVKSIDETLVKVESAGGKTFVGKTEIPKTGWFAILSDPEGSSFGIFEALKKPKPKKAKPKIKKKRRIKR